ncbi:MAG TPA: eL32 family ribosomal protein [Candidatus Nanoarchaeia archaeon]|nr:eL32 family ribosomal protein [Candidatus Nanoarchaeia archaeon]
MTLKKLLDVRKAAKAKKPTFRRQDWHLRKKYGEMWKRPRGQQSKMRLKVAGRGALVNPGYRSPRDVRGMSRDGKEVVWVSTLKDLKNIDGKKQTIIVSATVGGRNKLELLRHAIKHDISVYNVKNPAEWIKTVEDAFKQKKKKAPEKKQELKAEKKKEKSEEKIVDETEQRREAEKIMIQK